MRFLKFVILLIVYILFLSNCGRTRDQVKFVFWNVENYFHPAHDRINNDLEYTPRSYLKYTAKAYSLKCENLAMLLNSKTPHLIALAEIENKQVLQDLRSMLYFSNDFEIIHKDSPDKRGIDCAILFRKSIFTLLDSNFYHITLKNGRPTRDIVEVILKRRHHTIKFFVVHYPSRYGGAESAGSRNEVSRFLIDTIEANASPASDYVIISGDFNDELQDSSIQLLLNHDWKNYIVSKPEATLIEKTSNKKNHSYYYKNKWMDYDHFIILSNNSLKYRTKAKIGVIKKNILLNSDSQNEKIPFRFFNKRKIQGGFSDHLPILLELIP